MFRSTTFTGGPLANNFLGILNALQPNPVCLQCVRWRRKPRWLPVAKSKMFRIPERPQVPEDEAKELRRLNNNYNTLVRSVRRHIRESVGGITAQANITLQETTDEEDFERCSVLNDEWNKSVAKSRELRLAKERETRREHILNKLVEKEQKTIREIKEIDDKVKRVKEASVNFITADNIDQAIEDALANTVEYNWAIDGSGTIHHGKYVKQTPDENQRQKKAQQNF